MWRTPDFWYTPSLKGRVLQTLLRPLGVLYGAITARRMRQPARVRADIPVLCVGNLTMGGTGKTPVVRALIPMLRARGHNPVILSRGFGGRLKAPTHVDPTRHTAEEVGDEPLLLARDAPVIVSRNRTKALPLAKSLKATILVLDDGLQNPTLHKDITLAVIDGAVQYGNGLCFPAGPLRAPIHAQTPFVDAWIEIGGDKHFTPSACFQADIQPDSDTLNALRDIPLVAFCGLGRPQKFFDTLQKADLAVRATHAFPDHHAFSAKDLIALKQQAHGAELITTQKDAMRLSDAQKAILAPLHVLPITLGLSADFESWLAQHLPPPAAATALLK
jgi:tetraacyldisaccharide 4'-kinase